MNRPVTRSEQIRAALGWQQWRLAKRLRVKQATVARIEGGQPESGPVSLLLDILAHEIGRPDLALAEPRLVESALPPPSESAS